jgi:hypothetical protein
MARSKQNSKREERIDMEIIVDCYNESECWSGWYGYLEDKLRFPFSAKCRKLRDGSPLKKGEVVEIVGMVDNGSHGLPEMTVKVKWQGRTLGVPLEQLEGVKVDPITKEAIADWHYWCAQGRCF